MTTPKPDIPGWPRLLSREQAARYCGVTANTLEHHCPVRSVRIGTRRLWDRNALDRWVDGLANDTVSLSGSDWLRRLDDGHAA